MRTSQLRIIGGKWRGRKIRFPEIEGLRPTTDYVRETLFNWLAPQIVNSNCLDLFAGSGALGIEALSRGASQVLFVDSSPAVVAQLKATATILQQPLAIHKLFAPKGLSKLPPLLFDIVFIDPPYNKNLVEPCCQWFATHPCLNPKALIYIETERRFDLAKILPTNWQIIHNKISGHVRYSLIET